MLYVMKSIQLNRTLYVCFLLAGCLLAALMLAFCLDALFMLYLCFTLNLITQLGFHDEGCLRLNDDVLVVIRRGCCLCCCLCCLCWLHGLALSLAGIDEE